MSKILIGRGVTDSNGIATMTEDASGNSIQGYTGTGAGEVDFSAGCTIDGSSFQSETYELIDSLFYQNGTTEPPTNTWVLNNFTAEYGSTGTTITSTTFATCFANKPRTGVNVYDWDSPVCIEFDVVSVTSTDADIQLYDNTNNVTRSFNVLGITGNNHVKIVVESDKIRYFVDDVEKTAQQYNLTMGTFRVGLRATGTVTFKNFMIYPI